MKQTHLFSAISAGVIYITITSRGPSCSLGWELVLCHDLSLKQKIDEKRNGYTIWVGCV